MPERRSAHTVISGIERPRLAAHTSRMRPFCERWLLPAIFLVISVPYHAAIGQTPEQSQTLGGTPTAGSQDLGSAESDSNNPRNPSDGGLSASISNSSAYSALSSDQIIEFLQLNPDLVVELKFLAADRLQQQGVQTDANDISDQMLYDQIASNAALRAGITTFLRARGYTADSDPASLISGANTQSDFALPASQRLGQVDTQGAFGSSGEAGPRRAQTLNDNLAPIAGRTNLSGGRGDRDPGRSHQSTSADLPQVLRRTAPYNLRSMRDLYTQFPDETAPLKRFGSEVFVNRDLSSIGRGAASGDTPLDVPLGPDYVVGPGDTLQIDLWGGVTQTLTRVIGRDGRILLPDVGSLGIAGLPLEHAQQLIEGALKPQYRNAQVAVTVAHLHSVRVYVVGDVQRPGGYDISSLATPLSALFAAGGPTSVGSLRTLRHLRGQQLVEEIDLYDFLLHGIRNGSGRFESGDTLLVPPAGRQVAISGAVKRPAIYELKAAETTLAALIEDAGGLTPAASLGHITVDRIDTNLHRETITLPAASAHGPKTDRDAVTAFQLRDADRIRIEPILPYSERAIYLEGHVVRPGRLPYNDGMHLSDVLRSYRDLLPEPGDHGEIVRLVPPDLHAETIGFNVPDVLIGNANADLQPLDTVRIFGRYEVDAPKVTIRGEVLRPGSYPLSTGMTAAQLVRMAGGFKRDALLESADLTSYTIANGNQIVASLNSIPIGAAVNGTEPGGDVALKAGDILSIHQITNWNDIGESITVDGQARFPGSYGFREGERLSSILRRVGGLLPTAYPSGAVLVREQVRELEQKSREELIRQIETNSAAARLSPNLGAADSGAALQLIKAQQEQVLADLKSHPPTGRMVIHINADIDSWANTSDDIEVRPGDLLTIPKQPGFVLVTGQVYNATALTYSPDKTAAWYLRRAGGTNATANRKEIFIVRANGSVIGRHSQGWLQGDVLSARLNPGDVVVVPQKIMGSSLLWRNLLTAAQLASSIAITAAVAAL